MLRNLGCCKYGAVLAKLAASLSTRRLMFWLPCLHCDLAPGPGDDRVDVRQQPPPLISSLPGKRRPVWRLSQWILQYMHTWWSHATTCFSVSYHVHPTSTYFSHLSLSSLHTNSLSPPLQWNYIGVLSCLVYLVFSPGIPTVDVFWMREETPAGRLIKSLVGVLAAEWTCLIT